MVVISFLCFCFQVVTVVGDQREVHLRYPRPDRGKRRTIATPTIGNRQDKVVVNPPHQGLRSPMRKDKASLLLTNLVPVPITVYWRDVNTKSYRNVGSVSANGEAVLSIYRGDDFYISQSQEPPKFESDVPNCVGNSAKFQVCRVPCLSSYQVVLLLSLGYGVVLTISFFHLVQVVKVMTRSGGLRVVRETPLNEMPYQAHQIRPKVTVQQVGQTTRDD